MEKRVGSHAGDVDLQGVEELLSSVVIKGALQKFMLQRTGFRFTEFTQWRVRGTHPVQSMLSGEQVKQHFSTGMMIGQVAYHVVCSVTRIVPSQ